MGTGTKPHTLKPIKTDYNGYNETVTLLKSKFFMHKKVIFKLTIL